jgi:hypothetical protein
VKKALLAIVGLLLALGVGLYVFVARPLVSPSPETPAVEAALATPDLLLLGGVNVRQLAFLGRWFLGAPLVGSGRDPPMPPAVRPGADQPVPAPGSPRRPAACGRPRVVRGRPTDPTNCKSAAPWRVTAAPRWILLTDAASAAALLPRLTSPPRDKGEMLTWWRSLARADLTALGAGTSPTSRPGRAIRLCEAR